MIKSVSQSPLYALLSPDNNIVYDIPPYQREYSWGRDQWDALFDDLLEEDAESGHFLGTIICVNKTEDTAAQSVLELVDGQQRMTTLSLLLLALYRELAKRSDSLDDDQRSDLTTLRRMLCLREPTRQRLRLQRQNSNSNDYAFLLRDAGFDLEKPHVTYVGVRRISKALVHFTKRIGGLLEGSKNETHALLDLYSRIKQAILVKLEVETHSDAFVLFESLNNRGLPLTPIDLIKTSLLSVADKLPEVGVDRAYAAWSSWLDALGDDYGSQERFFRQFYNAFRVQWDLGITGITIAYRSKLIRIYEELVRKDLAEFMDRMDRSTSAYGRILGNLDPSTPPNEFDEAIRDLTRAQGTPAQMLLLYLVVNRDRFGLTDVALAAIAELLTKFFVRRNLTNTPPTYDLDRLFVSIIEGFESDDHGDIFDTIRDALRLVSATDEQFLAQLSGPIYDDNVAVTRFVLTTLAKQGMTKETHQDLWARSTTPSNKEVFVWTIEHILPQGENLPAAWIDMLGGREEALRVQRDHVHQLGNLTVTGYNSTLGNRSFSEKRDRTDADGNFVGYRNKLNLNEDIVSLDRWSEAEIVARTAHLANRAVDAFRF